MDPRQTPTDEPPSPLPGVRGELLALVRSLRGHVEELAASGAWGSPAPAREAPSTRAEAPPPASAETTAPAAAVPGVRAPAARAEREAAPSPGADAASRALIHLPQASIERLRQLSEETAACTRCSLHEGRRQTVFARGGGSSGVVFVGEGPGEEEDRQGLPFVGPAGQLLDRMIAAMQLGRDDVYVCNIVKCRPPKNRKPEPDEMERCMPFLVEQLTLIEPRVIVALGATAVQGLLGTTEGITRLRGQWKLWRGKVPVMPTFHPAYLLRTPQAKREVWKDLQEVLRHLKEAPRRLEP